MSDPEAILPTTQTRFADYARVSSDWQKEKQISVPQQHRENRQYALGQGGLFVREFQDEAITGTVMDRPGLQALLAWAREGATPEAGATVERQGGKGQGKRVVTRNAFADVLVVWKLDRLTRPGEDDDLDFLVLRRDLRACGLSLASVTEPWVADASEMGQFMGYLGRGQTKVEQVRRDERFRLGRQGIAEAQGRQVGPPPYGYDWEDPADGISRADVKRGRPWRTLEPQATWVRYIYRRYREGAAINQVTRELNAAGAPAPAASGHGAVRGGGIQRTHLAWTNDAVGRILKNRRYAGYVQFGGQWYPAAGKPGGHAAVITLEDWEAAQAIREGRGGRRAASATTLFAGGLLACPHCAAAGRDSRLVVATTTDNVTCADGTVNRHVYNTYKCGLHHAIGRRRRLGAPVSSPCPAFQISERKVLGLLLAVLRRLARTARPGDAEKAAGALRPRRQDLTRQRAAQRAEVLRQIAQLPAMETNYQAQQAMGLMTLDKLAATLTALREREASLRAQAEALAADVPAETLSAVDALRLLRLLQDGDAPPLAKRDALAAAFERLTPSADRTRLDIQGR